jgi:hypothetical protein
MFGQKMPHHFQNTNNGNSQKSGHIFIIVSDEKNLTEIGVSSNGSRTFS